MQPDFASFYAAVHPGRKPFPWQEALAEQVLGEGEWPDISVPTAAGKTSVLDIAVFALAMQAEAGRRAPRRIFFVVDRRLVVDEAYTHAQEIAKALQTPADEVVAAVRDRLLAMQVPGSSLPLAVARLRGGVYAGESWIDTPDQPLICVSTVDQVGSRLLFRGYGVTPQRRPVDAGLVGTDSLVIVDEAHLSRPFVDTLSRVRKLQRLTQEKPIGAPLRLVVMSATLDAAANRPVVGLTERDLANELLAKRLSASKIALLKDGVPDLPAAAAAEATALLVGSTLVAGIVLNTVKDARATYELLAGRGHEAILLTGRVRPWDRDGVLKEFLARMKANRDRAANRKPLFVVATQTVEVGANLDFDALVTQAAPLDALRQRFGRLDRLGELGKTRAVILRPKSWTDTDWIYGEPLRATWRWLTENATADGKEKVVDFGVDALRQLIGGRSTAELETTKEPGPVLFPAHIDAWAQTNPEPVPDPPIAPFLHGKSGAQSADVSIVWRADLGGYDPSEWTDIVAMVPPTPAEALPMPIWTVRKWLDGSLDADVPDLEGVAPAEEVSSDEPLHEIPFLIWTGPEASVPGRRRPLRPGDTVVVRTVEGGCDRFGWNPESAEVSDVGDDCSNERARAGRGRFRLRRKASDVLAGDVEDRDLRTIFRDDLPNKLRDGKNWRVQVYGAEDARWLIGVSAWSSRQTGPDQPEAEDTDGDENSSLNTTETGISLSDHTGRVVQRAAAFVRAVGLNGVLETAMGLAARMHDLGKSDVRFQLLLDPYGEATAPAPLAKGVRRERNVSLADYRIRKQISGYPSGARHEFASMMLAEHFAAWPDEEVRDISLYLIATHHGYGRALAPVWVDEEAETITADVNGQRLEERDVSTVAGIDSSWVDRFWRMQRRFGWWGAAFLEGILRRADCTVSREEERNEARSVRAGIDGPAR